MHRGIRRRPPVRSLSGSSRTDHRALVNSQWSLEGEIARIADREHLVDALEALGLLDSDEALVDVATSRDWHRSGEETYSLVFAVNTDRANRAYLMKACVAYDHFRSLKEIFASWLDVREYVRSLGIGTPQLHAVGGALVIEEVVPYALAEAFGVGDRRALLRGVGTTAACLVNAGFAPSSVDDWRSRGDDVVLVDFGQDLGSPGMFKAGTEAGLLADVLASLDRTGVRLAPGELQLLGEAYEAVLWRT